MVGVRCLYVVVSGTVAVVGMGIGVWLSAELFSGCCEVLGRWCLAPLVGGGRLGPGSGLGFGPLGAISRLGILKPLPDLVLAAGYLVLFRQDIY